MRDYCCTKHLLVKQHLKSIVDSNVMFIGGISRFFLILRYLKIKPLDVTCFSVRRTQIVIIIQNGTRMVKNGSMSKFSFQFIVDVAQSVD